MTDSNPAQRRHPVTGAHLRFGVMGSAASGAAEALKQTCRELGRAVANEQCCLITGACPGLPHEAAMGAKAAGGHVIGISPASSLQEHIEVFQSPHIGYDEMIYTGLGLMGRELVNIHSSDIVLIVGGRCGTLGEFAIAYQEGKLIGVLEGSGGITTALPQMARAIRKETGAEILYDRDAVSLVRRLLQRFHETIQAASGRWARAQAESGRNSDKKEALETESMRSGSDCQIPAISAQSFAWDGQQIV